MLNLIKRIFIVILVGVLAGCKTIPAPVTVPAQLPAPQSTALAKEKRRPLKPRPEQPIVIPEINMDDVPPQGKIFAKTEFEGVVKKSFIRLTIIDREDHDKIYKLYIGDKSRQLDFWNAETIQPGYFLIDLPAGSYAIASLSIPVGSTLATELMNVVFDVKPDKTVYLGTLSVVGTREKIKFGGVPVIKPGFEYTVRVENEFREALPEFTRRFPDSRARLDVQLMKDLGREK